MGAETLHEDAITRSDFAHPTATGASLSNSVACSYGIWVGNQEATQVGQERPDRGTHVTPHTALLRSRAEGGMWSTVGARAVSICDPFLGRERAARLRGTRTLI